MRSNNVFFVSLLVSSVFCLTADRLAFADEVMEEIVVTATREGVFDPGDVDTFRGVDRGDTNISIIFTNRYILRGAQTREEYENCRETSGISFAACEMKTYDKHYDWVQKCGYMNAVPAFDLGVVKFGGGTLAQCHAEGEAWRDASLATCRFNHVARNARCRGGEENQR